MKKEKPNDLKELNLSGQMLSARLRQLISETIKRSRIFQSRLFFKILFICSPCRWLSCENFANYYRLVNDSNRASTVKLVKEVLPLRSFHSVKREKLPFTPMRL